MRPGGGASETCGKQCFWLGTGGIGAAGIRESRIGLLLFVAFERYRTQPQIQGSLMSFMFGRHGRVPEPIYKLLPVIYLLTGGWVFSVGQGVLAVISGLLLWLASALVFLWRRDARLLQSTKRRKFR